MCKVTSLDVYFKWYNFHTGEFVTHSNVIAEQDKSIIATNAEQSSLSNRDLTGALIKCQWAFVKGKACEWSLHALCVQQIFTDKKQLIGTVELKGYE